MPKEWPAQPRFLEVLKTLRSASKVKLDELESLALADARQYYKHAVAILVKQLQVKRPRQRVPILYAINTLATHARDAEVGKIYAGRFAPEIVACVAAALKCPPEHVRGVRAVLRRWRRRGTFDPSVLRECDALLAAYAGGEATAPAAAPAGNQKTDDADEDTDDYRLSDDEEETPASARAADAATTTTTTTTEASRPALDFGGKTRVNRWPAKPPPRAKPAAEAPADAASDSAAARSNPPPPNANARSNPAPPGVGASARSNPPPPGGRAGRPRVDPSPPRQRSPPPRDGRNGGGGYGGGRGGGGRGGDGSSRATAVDRWGDPVRGGSADGGRGRSRSPAKVRSPPRRRSPSPAKVRSPPRRRSPSPAKVRSPRGGRGRGRSRSRSRSRLRSRSPEARAPREPSPPKMRSPPRANGRDGRDADSGGSSSDDDGVGREPSGMRLPWVAEARSPLRDAAQFSNRPSSLAWSPAARNRTARNREMLMVARNAREQAKENDFLRQRVRELERELGAAHERQHEARVSKQREADFKQREAALKAEAAAYEAAAAQLEEELERMRAIEEQSAVEAMSLVQKTSRLQTDLAAAQRRAAIAEEMLAGVQSEGERAVEDAERWRAEAERVEREHAKQTELEARYGAAMAELQALRDENGKMRADIAALHSGMEAQLRAEEAESPSASDADADANANASRGDGETSGGEDTFGTPAGAAEPASAEKASTSRPPSRPSSPSIPTKGDGVIYLRGRAVKVEGATPRGERPPPPRRRWASPMHSSFTRKIMGNGEPQPRRTPSRAQSQPHLELIDHFENMANDSS